MDQDPWFNTVTLRRIRTAEVGLVPLARRGWLGTILNTVIHNRCYANRVLTVDEHSPQMVKIVQFGSFYAGTRVNCVFFELLAISTTGSEGAR